MSRKHRRVGRMIDDEIRTSPDRPAMPAMKEAHVRPQRVSPSRQAPSACFEAVPTVLLLDAQSAEYLRCPVFTCKATAEHGMRCERQAVLGSIFCTHHQGYPRMGTAFAASKVMRLRAQPERFSF